VDSCSYHRIGRLFECVLPIVGIATYPLLLNYRCPTHVPHCLVVFRYAELFAFFRAFLLVLPRRPYIPYPRSPFRCGARYCVIVPLPGRTQIRYPIAAVWFPTRSLFEHYCVRLLVCVSHRPLPCIELPCHSTGPEPAPALIRIGDRLQTHNYSVHSPKDPLCLP